MKKILGLDLGTTSIGWAWVHEAENEKEKSEIVKLGVRVNPLSSDELNDFEKGNPLTTNAKRTAHRGARRNLQRFKLRRQKLIELLIKRNIISTDSLLTEKGRYTTYETLNLRAKAVAEKIEKEELARVFLTINKKRGYKSSRKAKNEEEGNLIDGMSVARELYDLGLTPGQFVYKNIKEGKHYVPDFYQSDLRNEFDKIWKFQQQFYPNVLTDDFYLILQNHGLQSSRKRFLAVHNIFTAENKGKKSAVKEQHYLWRSTAVNTKLHIEQIAYVLCEINNNLNNSSGYLGAISDRSKKLYFKQITVGQYLYQQVLQNRHTPLKNQVFYRQDYLDEFEKIWETQAQFHPELTLELKEEVRDIVIFYQRKLKSQKGLISLCEFEKRIIDLNGKKKQIGPKVIPKSSPVFQEFKIWQNLNNISITKKGDHHNSEKFDLDIDAKQFLFEELNVKGKLKKSEILKLLNFKHKEYDLNFEELEGNNTSNTIYEILQNISTNEGYGFDWNKKTAQQIKEELYSTLPQIGIDPKILDFDIEAPNFQQQISYQFWHLLYSVEDDVNTKKEDQKIYGKNDVSLKKKLHTKFGIPIKYLSLFSNIKLDKDYGNLSNKAIKKIIPFLKEGHIYSESCGLAGYNHANSITSEENLKRELKTKLDLLTKNSLRNPVVEKILNQLVNIVNQLIDTYGNPDEIRIELARELKNSAKQRKKITAEINAATKRNIDYKKTLQKAPFLIKNPTKNDVIKYRLYLELEPLGFKTIYTNQYIAPHLLFSKNIDIEHIIPKAKLYDDSFSNKTLAFRDINRQKADHTSYNFIEYKYNKELDAYKNRIQILLDKGTIKKGKALKLLMPEHQLKEGFIKRDLVNTQYIAKKAKTMLFDVTRKVTSTNGHITDKLRNDWNLINVLKELTLPKYKTLGLTKVEKRKNGNTVEQIIDWTKRNDHRHHAMDALTTAFTTQKHIQYFSTYHAKNETKDTNAIKAELTHKIDGKTVFISPMENFRAEAKKHISSILVSFKSKNKVVTKNVNTFKKGNQICKKTQLTPRGQLHKETVYGSLKREIIKEEKIGASFDFEKINTVTKPEYRNLLLDRLKLNNNNAKKAFAGKNALSKKPILLSNGKQMPLSVLTKKFETTYTIRKEINADNFKDLKSLDKIIDVTIRKILQKRLAIYDNKAKEAFSNLDTNPIWINQKQGIQIKRVTITGISNAVALHDKKDNYGKYILDAKEKKQAVNFVSTGNNHHVAIYKDEKGKLHEKVVSLFDAVTRKNENLPIIDKNYHSEIGWSFLFTLKQNELFIFPSNDFNPKEIDLLDPKNYSLISPHLFRVQSISTKDYFFRHHLETIVTNNTNFTYKRIRNCNALKNIIKVRTNHLGEIVQIGEY